MTDENQISDLLKRLQLMAPAGFAIALHVVYTTPTFLFRTYPKKWADEYSQNGYVMVDPTVAWGFSNTGTKPWSEMSAEDTAGVLTKAADHGLKFGISVATAGDDSRSICSFAHSEREFSDGEVSELKHIVETLHALTTDLDKLSPELAARLKTQAVLVDAQTG